MGFFLNTFKSRSSIKQVWNFCKKNPIWVKSTSARIHCNKLPKHNPDACYKLQQIGNFRNAAENTFLFIFMFLFNINTVYLKKPHRLVIWDPSCGLRDVLKWPMLGFGWLPKPAGLYCTCTVLLVSILWVCSLVSQFISHLQTETPGRMESSAWLSLLCSLTTCTGMLCLLCFLFQRKIFYI